VIASLFLAAAALSASGLGLVPLLRELGPDAAFAERHMLVNQQGRTVSRVQQLHLGHRVWGAEAIVHTEPDGSQRVIDRGVLRDVHVEGSPRLSGDEAAAVALRDLAAQETPQHSAELVVFPSRFTGGLATRLDPDSGKLCIDRAHSVITRPPAAPYVWAYEVRTFVMSAADGHREESYVVDARTGAILRKWSALRRLGTGHSFFRGTIPLQTTQAADGTYVLLAQGRGTLPNAYAAALGFTQPGVATYTNSFDIPSASMGILPYAGHAADDWGNGNLIPMPWDWSLGLTLVDYNADSTIGWPHLALTPAGETTAVDAHFGVTAGWDFYKSVFSRNGIDGNGTSTLAVVHALLGSTPISSSPYADRMSWSPTLNGVAIGDGTYPTLPSGWMSLAGVDLIGHELAHGVALASIGTVIGELAAAVDEGNSDILGKMLQAWTDGHGDTTIPDFDPADPTRWQLGLGGLPNNGVLRYMDRPSDDGRSGDLWYDGLQDLGPHFASGPIDRFFVLLSQGVSTDPNSRRFSAYLKGGLTGIGNDRAARIWYRALTEYLIAVDDFDGARSATVTAAQELYGEGSNEEQAVMKAWAAVNVGSAPGEGPRVRVTLPVTNGPDSFLGTNAYPQGSLGRVQFFPTRARVTIRADVANSSDTGILLGSSQPVVASDGSVPADAMAYGHINDDGTWTTPSFTYGDLLPLFAISHADPLQFAQAHALIVELDTDLDGDVDAVDLGLVAATWGARNNPFPAASTSGQSVVTDWDVVFFNEAFADAWARSSAQ
jgi:Zn-dependent metalloprotease